MDNKGSLASLKNTLRKIDSLYDFYAKSVGLNYASISILQMLYEDEREYTQKEICNELGLPKQFVNSIISGFYEQGFVHFKEGKDRRNKIILVTNSGKDYAHKILSPLNDAEKKAWGSLSDEELGYLDVILKDFYKSLSVSFDLF